MVIYIVLTVEQSWKGDFPLSRLIFIDILKSTPSGHKSTF